MDERVKPSEEQTGTSRRNYATEGENKSLGGEGEEEEEVGEGVGGERDDTTCDNVTYMLLLSAPEKISVMKP